MPSVQAFLYLVDAEGNFMNGTSLLASRQATYTMQKKSFLYVDTAGPGPVHGGLRRGDHHPGGTPSS